MSERLQYLEINTRKICFINKIISTQGTKLCKMFQKTNTYIPYEPKSVLFCHISLCNTSSKTERNTHEVFSKNKGLIQSSFEILVMIDV